MEYPWILIVEDDPTQQHLFKLLQSRCGFKAYVVESWDELQQLITNSSLKQFDLIFMDWQLVGSQLDGVECAQMIRQQEKANNWKRTPIIAVTAHAMRGDRERCLAADMDDYISKPIAINMLCALVHKWSGKGMFGDSHAAGNASAG